MLAAITPQENIPGTHFFKRPSQHLDQSAAGRIISMKNSNDNIRDRNHDLLACSVVLQPSAPLHASGVTVIKYKS
jgi:hypothetical protein